jgi:hypothetical protein
MAKTGDKHYGEWAIMNPPVLVLNADRILGVHIAHDKQERPDFVTVQYQTADDSGVQAIRMDYLNALFLLSCLKSIQLDEGSPFPDDPRALPEQ